ncbi:MAG: hypothetical protein FWG90_13385 [Oscillospiraceae bacterium]|nr:hypothetical protein [Oscillospiraceae bacterium]
MIDSEQFPAVLNVISTGLAEKIINETSFEEDVAIEKLYSSALYSELEKEDTEVWHYSVTKLYDLWNKEIQTGRLELI